MNVIHIFNSLKFSGAEIMYVDAAKYFQSYGCNLSVIATNEDLGEFADNFKSSGYDIYHFPYPTSFLEKLKYTFKLKKFLKNKKIDLVHIHSNKMFFHYSFIAWLIGIKSLYTFHNVFPTKKHTRLFHIIKRVIVKNIFKCQFQTISDSVYNNELVTFKNKTTKIDNWYGGDRYYPTTDKFEKSKLRKEMNLNEDAFIVISVGGCSHVKRHCEIIHAISLLIEKIPNIIYLHLGTGEDEVAEKELVKKLKLEEHVYFLGNQQNVRNYLIASDIYIMPSKFEGTPITTIEAMACDIPSVLYNVPGLRDFNTENENSILIEPDYKVLAQTIFDVYQNKIDAKVISDSAKQLVDNKYNIQKNSKKIYDLYRKD